MINLSSVNLNGLYQLPTFQALNKRQENNSKAVHNYEEQIRPPAFLNTVAYTADPIGISEKGNKTSELKDKLSGVDLRNISPNQFSKLAYELLHLGEISNLAAGQFMATDNNVEGRDPDVPIDMIQNLENSFSWVSDLNSKEQGWKRSVEIYSDALHTIYNIDSFMASTRKGVAFQEEA
jgi:hypothetical protein